MGLLQQQPDRIHRHTLFQWWPSTGWRLYSLRIPYETQHECTGFKIERRHTLPVSDAERVHGLIDGLTR